MTAALPPEEIERVLAAMERIGSKRSETMNVGPVRVALIADAARLIRALRADKERLDYLSDEWYREECWRDAGMPSGAPFSLFRQNLPITRDTIDAARERWGCK